MADAKVETPVPAASTLATTHDVVVPAPVQEDANKPPMTVEIDETNPVDFDGEVTTTHELPSPEILKKINDYVVLDKHGKSHTFQSLYNGPNSPRRVLIIFVRHFFCGNCQDYLKTLSESITPQALLGLPISTFITVIGCGDPKLIDMYVEATNCPFPLYTDPTRQLFDALDMVKTLSLGERPAYMKSSLLGTTIKGISQALKSVPKGLTLKSGDQRQVGGEFLFEPLDLATPVTTPQDERQMASFADTLSQGAAAAATEELGARPIEEKRVTWCHRMKSTRDHAEIPELMEILGLDGSGKPNKDDKRWALALEKRKGTGLSLASQMKAVSESQE